MINYDTKGFTILYLGAALVILIAAFFVNSINTAVADGTVAVTATVASSVTCSTDNTSSAFGTLTSSVITSSTTNASTTISCNTGLGCTFNINDANAGLATTSPSYTIPTVQTGLVAGTEGYGIQAATTTAGSGGLLIVKAGFIFNTTSTVGRLNTTSTLLASSTSAVSARIITITHKAAISGTTQAGSYVDTITLACVGN